MNTNTPINRKTLLALGLGLSVVLLALVQVARHRVPAQPVKSAAQSSLASQPTGETTDAATRAHVNEAFGKMPLHFVENRGQVDERVAYYIQGRDKSIYFTNQGLTFVLNGKAEAPDHSSPQLQPASYHPADNPQSAIPNPQSPYALKLDFIGARADARPEGTMATGAVFSYFKGPQSEWKAGIKSYSEITYRELWPGIDLVYAGTVNRMKYTFVVKPGADPNQIKLAYRGANSVQVNDKGELEVKTPAGGFNDDRPISWQGAGAQQTDVPTAFRLEKQSASQSTTVYGFTVGEYDRSRELVIDPAMFVYAGFIGGASGSERGNAIAVDSAGNAYVTGQTQSDQGSFPDGDGFGAVPGFNQTMNAPPNSEAFVVKVNAAGTALVYATYIGGSKTDRGNGIVVDSAGNAYVTGLVSSSGLGFPTLNGPDTTLNGGDDAFVTKLNPAGTGLVYSGFIGGSSSEQGLAIALDSASNAYVTGYTQSDQTTFPDGDGFNAVPGFDQTHNGSRDAFVVKVKADGSGLDYATYLGGGQGDEGYGIAVDSAGNAYVAGGSESTGDDFPNGTGFAGLAVPGYDQTQNDNGNDWDAFVVKLNPAGLALLYGTFMGGTSYDFAFGIAIDSAGNAYIAGQSYSADTTFPNGGGFVAAAVPGFDQTHNSPGESDAIVVKLNPAGTALVYATYLGSSAYDDAFGIAVNNAGNAYVTGEADAGDFPTLGGPDTTFNGGSYDAYATKLNPGGTALVYSGFIGGIGDDFGLAVALDSAGNAYVTGRAGLDFVPSLQDKGLAGKARGADKASVILGGGGGTFPDGDGFGTLPSFDNTHNGGTNDSFVVKIQDSVPPTIACPANQTANTGAGLCTAVVNYPAPTATGSPAPTITCTPASGSVFNKGVTTVTCTAANGTLPDATCSFTVTVTDTQPPTITCPANIFMGTAGTSATATWTAPTVSDNCPGVAAPVCSPASGSSFNVGVTTVTCTVADAVNNTATCSFTVTVNRVTNSISDPLVCIGPGNTVQATLTISNNSNVNQNVVSTTTFTNLVGVPGSCTVSPNVGTCTVTNSGVSYTGTLTPGTTVSITYLTQVSDLAPAGAPVCANNSVTFNGGPALTVSACGTVNCPASGPGGIFPARSEASDQGAGSVLIYNIYTSGATSGNTQNTRVNITNVHPTLPAFVHLFFVSEGCSVADSYVCLTGNQTTSFLASDLDPGTTGYLVAVAVNAIGCPTNFNYLIGDEYVKFTTGHAANLGAEAISAIAGGLPLCDGNSVTAQLDFNGIAYDLVSHVLALDNVGSRADGNDTLLILNRIGGNLGTGAGSLSSIFGIFYDDAENALSFTFNGGHQFRSSLSNNFPRLTPRFETFIPAGRTGWFKLWPTTGLWGMTGVAINFNANAASSAGAFNQGHNLHKLRLTNTANYVIPVFPPSC